MSGSTSCQPDFRFSCLPAIRRALTHASHQVRCWRVQMHHDVRCPALSAHVPPQQRGVAEPWLLHHHQCLHHQQLLFFTCNSISSGAEFAASSLTIAQEGSCEPHPTLAVGLPSEGAPTVLSRFFFFFENVYVLRVRPRKITNQNGEAWMHAIPLTK